MVRGDIVLGDGEDIVLIKGEGDPTPVFNRRDVSDMPAGRFIPLFRLFESIFQDFFFGDKLWVL